MLKYLKLNKNNLKSKPKFKLFLKKLNKLNKNVKEKDFKIYGQKNMLQIH
jgi:hypothetical protein